LSTSAFTSHVEVGFVGEYSSVTIGTDGLGLISYHDAANTSLKVAHCSNLACTTSTKYTLDNSANVGYYTSITINNDGLGLISYLDASPNDNLKVAKCLNVLCSAATITTLDIPGGTGYHSSITTGPDGFGLIAYFTFTNYDLKVAHCSNAACTSASITTVESTDLSGSYPSITIGFDGFALITYFHNSTVRLKIAHLSNPFGVPFHRRR
jgi:hypothetical protein